MALCFVVAAGFIQIPLSRSMSAHLADRTSLLRAPVMISRAIASAASLLCNSSSALQIAVSSSAEAYLLRGGSWLRAKPFATLPSTQPHRMARFKARRRLLFGGRRVHRQGCANWVGVDHSRNQYSSCFWGSVDVTTHGLHQPYEQTAISCPNDKADSPHDFEPIRSCHD